MAAESDMVQLEEEQAKRVEAFWNEMEEKMRGPNWMEAWQELVDGFGEITFI